MPRLLTGVFITSETGMDWSVMRWCISETAHTDLWKSSSGGDDLINEGVKTLKELSGKIDTGRMKQPSFLMVLTAVGFYAYRREDGVYVVPVGCLKD